MNPLQYSRFESLGLYLPEKTITTEELVNQLENPPGFDLVEITGIKSRHVRGEKEDTFTLSVDAAKDCLKNSLNS